MIEISKSAEAIAKEKVDNMSKEEILQLVYLGETTRFRNYMEILYKYACECLKNNNWVWSYYDFVERVIYKEKERNLYNHYY